MGDEGAKGKEEAKPILGFKGVDEFSQEGIKRVIEATRAFQALPQAGPLWDLQKSYPEFTRAMRNSRTRILPIMKTLLEHAKISTHDFKRRDLEEKFDFLVESNDDILERIATALDDASGMSTRTEILVVNPTQAPKPSKPPGIWAKRKPVDASADFIDSTQAKATHLPPQSTRPIKKAVHRIIEKPQLKFKVPVDNSLTPFVPLLKEKPNSLKPLSILPEFNGKNEEFYGHPYQVELNRWEPDDNQMTRANPQLPPEVTRHPLVVVQTPEELETVMNDLRNASEIAVDVEHHSYRTFLGITCLIQLSTRTTDYVIDAIALRDELGVLNEVLTKPKVMKVFHGAASDIEWLQRDFGLYVVGMFDTFVAAKQLGLQQLSLQHLLIKYCNVNVDKKYQLADWRIRPIPPGMLNYARQDTHYLLYIYDLMKNELIDAGNQFSNLLKAVYDESNTICLKRFEKPTVNPQLALRKTGRVLNNRQVYAYSEIFKWRDAVAREKDESLGFVLPNHMLLMISESLPKEMTGILACCDPVPSLVQANLGLIHRIVLKARDLPVHEEKLQVGTAEKRKKQKNWVVIMNSIHDIEGDEPVDEVGVVCQSKPKVLESDVSKRTWPESWKDPTDMAGIQIRKKPTFMLGQSKQDRKGKSNFSVPLPKENRASRYCSNPFERYQLSCQILEMLKDPKKKEQVDMNDPTVRVVYDTIYVDPAELEAASVKKLSQVNQELISVLPKRDFVPFNPVADYLRSQAEDSKKNKKKKANKHEPWDDTSVRSERSTHSSNDVDLKSKLDTGFGLEDGEIDEEQEAAQKFVPIPKSKSEHRRDRKKKKGGLINKLKFWKKRKHEDECEAGDDNDDVICLSPPEVPPPKRFKDIQAEKYPTLPDIGKGRGSNGKHKKNKGKEGGGRGRGRKTGFFNSLRRPDGRSITYK